MLPLLRQTHMKFKQDTNNYAEISISSLYKETLCLKKSNSSKLKRNLLNSNVKNYKKV